MSFIANFTLGDSGSTTGKEVEVFESRTRVYPLARDPDHFIERRVYQIDFEEFRPLDLGSTAPNDLSNAYLVNQGWVNRIGNYLRFFREYANIPESGLREPDTITYEFIGFRGDEERERFTKTVNAEIQFDYFLPGVTKGINVIDDVEVVSALKYHAVGDEAIAFNYINNNETLFTESVPSRTTYKGWISDGTDIVAEDSARGIYRGPIIERRTPYIKAQ